MGLGTGYLIYGPQELRGYPERSKEVDWPTGLWGIALPGFLQFFTGAHDDPVGGLCIGLTGVYVSDVFATVKADLPPKLGSFAERSLGFFHLGTGLWLIYLMFAVALNCVLAHNVPL